MNASISGPHVLDESWPFVAYVAHLQDDQHMQAICFTALSKDEELLTKNFSALVTMIIAQASSTFDLSGDFGLIATLQPGDSPDTNSGQLTERSFTFQPYSNGKNTRPEDFAKAALKTLRLIHFHEVDGKTYKITEFAKDTESEFRDYDVQPTDTDIVNHVTARDLAQVLQILANQSEINHFEAEMYFTETIQSIEGSDFQSAFRSYYYAFQFGQNLDQATLLSVGKALAQGLLSIGNWDFADWVAVTVAPLAETQGNCEEAAQLWRFAGIASSMMGRHEETNRYFEHAVSLLDQFSNPILTVQVHMSYGLAMIDLFAHWETETIYFTNSKKDYNDFVQSKMKTAIQHLEITQTLIKEPSDDRSRFNLCAIELDLIRATDIAGWHEEALSLWNELIQRDYFIETEKTIATALFYRCAILRKLKEKQKISFEDYLAELMKAWDQLQNIENKPGDRLCCFLTLLADALMENGNSEEATGALLVAKNIQDTRQAYNIRLPGPENRYGGIPVIDLAGKIQSGFVSLFATTSDPKWVWQALQIADQAKGRYFRRDMIFSITDTTGETPATLKNRYAAMKELIRTGKVDSRILMADYAWFVARDLSAEQAADLQKQNSYELGINRDELPELFATTSETKAFLSCYTVAEKTYIYLLTGPNTVPEVFVLDIPLETLEKIASDFQKGMVGWGLYGAINPKRPEERDFRFAPFLGLRQAFAAIALQLRKFDRVIISPHGKWHNLPIHALFLPTLWEQDANPSISYAPSIHAFGLIQKRAIKNEPTALRPVGLAIAPSKQEENSAFFLAAHTTLSAIFEKANRPVLGAYSIEATAERVLQDLQQVGLQHVLCHGHYQSDEKVMNSGLALASQSGLQPIEAPPTLSAMALMVNEARARHVTVQACSLGKSQTTMGDELWGVTRALLASGVDSILTPMWNINKESSLALLTRFYENWLVQGQTKWQAFAEAQRFMAQKKEPSNANHFFYWAAFQLVGC